MTTSDLWKLRTIDREIDKLTEKYRALHLSLMPSGVRYDKDRVQTSPEEMLSEVIGQIVELEQLIIDKNRRKAELINEAYEFIEQLKSEKAQTVMVKYFIAGKSMRAIAYDMDLSKSAVHKIYQKSLKELQKGE